MLPRAQPPCCEQAERYFDHCLLLCLPGSGAAWSGHVPAPFRGEGHELPRLIDCLTGLFHYFRQCFGSGTDESLCRGCKRAKASARAVTRPERSRRSCSSRRSGQEVSQASASNCRPHQGRRVPDRCQGVAFAPHLIDHASRTNESREGAMVKARLRGLTTSSRPSACSRGRPPAPRRPLKSAPPHGCYSRRWGWGRRSSA